MKGSIFFLILIISFSCQITKDIEEKPICPKGYECYLEIESNKSIKALEDTIGSTYLRLESSQNSMVVKYIYKFKDNPMLADAGYSEIIYFQIPNETKNLNLENTELSDINLYIQKSCFCVDAGYEKIKTGKISISKNENNLLVDLEFTVNKKVKLNSVKTKIKI